MNQFITTDQSIAIDMGDKVPTAACSSKLLPKEKKERSSFCTKAINSSLVIFVLGVLVGFSCGVCITYFYIPCSLTKETSDGDLTATLNVTRFQSQTPAQSFDVCGMYNITFIDDGSHLQYTILQGIFNFLQTTEVINKSLPPFSEGGVRMLRKELLQVNQQLESDVQKAIKQLKKLQESLKPKPRRRHFKT